MRLLRITYLGSRTLDNSTEYHIIPDDCHPDLTADLVMIFASEKVGLSEERMAKLGEFLSKNELVDVNSGFSIRFNNDRSVRFGNDLEGLEAHIHEVHDQT